MTDIEGNRRREGSGRYGETTRIIENLLAKHISGERKAAGQLRGELQRKFDNLRCGMPASQINELLAQAATLMYPSKPVARRLNEGEGPGDLKVISDPVEWVEVKAQTQKAGLADLTQADWARDGCHGLRFLLANDPEFAEKMTSETRQWIDAPCGVAAGWTFSECCLADIAGLTTDSSLRQQNIENASDLRQFAARKQILILNQEGVFFGPLTVIDCVQAVCSGEELEYAFRNNRRSLAAVTVSGPPADETSSPVQFTYHVYPTRPGYGTCGRHKLHARAVNSDRINRVPATSSAA